MGCEFHPADPLDFRFLPAGAVPFEAGATVSHLHLISSGLVAMVSDMPDGSRRTVRLLKAGDVIGLEGLAGAPHRYTAVTLRKSTLCRVPIAAVQAAAETSPSLARRLQDHWRTALDRADAVILDFGWGGARRRVARLLLFLMAEPPDCRCTVFRREDMAAVLDLAAETVSRVLSEFQRRGILTRREANHFHADRAALEAEAGRKAPAPL